jgi:hypothetical protein
MTTGTPAHSGRLTEGRIAEISVSKLYPVLVVVAAALVSASAQAAQSAKHAKHTRRPPRVLLATPPKADFAQPGPAERPWSYTPVASPEQSDFPRTAVDYHLTSDGLTGSLGYLCVRDPARLSSEQESDAAASRLDHQSSFLGATLSYAFK